MRRRGVATSVNVTPCRSLRRCVMFLLTICVIPGLLVLLIVTDQYSRPFGSRQDDMFYYQANAVNESKNQLDMMPELNMSAMAGRMATRRQHLSEECHRLGLDIPGNDSLHKPNPWEFLVNHQYHLVWCNVFKAASTSWMFNFNLLAGYTQAFLRKSKIVPLVLARKKYPRPSWAELQTAMNDSITFLIVRHPFERLLSAYRDKMEYAIPLSLHQKLGWKIIMKYRPESKKNGKAYRARWTRWPTFEEFVRYLVDTHRAGNVLDMHWTPISEFCTPCMIHFDTIVKFDTLTEDQVYLIKQAKVENIIKPVWKNPGKNQKGVDLNALRKHYYSQLKKEQIYQLYNIYRYDFQLFNYTLDGYIDDVTSPVETENPSSA